jgi:hypothetical protein
MEQQVQKKKGGCGCKAQLGGSLASDSVVKHVDQKAWNMLNRNASANVVSATVHGGGSAGTPVASETSGTVALASHFKSFINGFLGTPVHVGGHSIDEVVRRNVSKRGMKKYNRALRKLNKLSVDSEDNQSGGKMDEFFNGLDALSGLVNMSKASSYLKGGRDAAAEGVDAMFNKLTLHGAEAITKLMTDTAVLSDGVSIASYMKQAVIDMPSDHAKTHIVELADKFKDQLTHLMITNLNTKNLRKIKMFADAYNTAPLPAPAPAATSGGAAANVGGDPPLPSFTYAHSDFPSVDSINSRPMPNQATASQNVAMLKYQNLLDPSYSYGFESLQNPVMQLLPKELRNTSVALGL